VPFGLHPFFFVDIQAHESISGGERIECGKLTNQICGGPLEIKGTFKALGFGTYQYAHVFKNSFVCTSGGSITTP